MSFYSVSSGSGEDLSQLSLHPLSQRDGNLGGRKVVRFLEDFNKENASSSNIPGTSNTPPSPQKVKKCFDLDRKWIEAALGSEQYLSEEEFGKKYGETKYSIMKATAQKIAEVRRSGQDAAVFELEKSGLEQRKVVVQLDEGEIKKLFIGTLLAAGSFTTVYRTLTHQVILIPKDRKTADTQMQHAYDVTCEFHEYYENIEDFHEETNGHFLNFNYSKEEFVQLLPPKSEKVQVGSKPILIDLQATCAKEIFAQAPASRKAVIDRVRDLLEASLGVALMHETGFVHSDLKPANMLKGIDGKVRPHDCGGGAFFYDSDSRKEASDKLLSLTYTPRYMHYIDACFAALSATSDKIDCYTLGCAGDVFALATTMIEALTGMHRPDGTKIFPFHNYEKMRGRSYVANYSKRRKFSCVKEISEQAGERLDILLRAALHRDFRKRPAAHLFAEELRIIHGMLLEAVSPRH